MATLQIIYETKYGQTLKIAERIADFARKRGHEVELRAVADVDARRLEEAAACVVLAPVFAGKHPPATRDFVARHAAVLNGRASMFVSVSGSAGSARAGQREAARQRALDFVATTGWRPNLIHAIGGAIAYPRYGFFTRLMMKMITKREGGPTDTSKTHELTDWRAVDQMTRDILALVEAKRVKARAAGAIA